MLVLVFLTATAGLFLLTLLAKYQWSRRKLIAFGNTLPGPLSFPLIGCAYLFACKNEEIFNRIEWILAKYEHPMKIWLGPKLIAVFSKMHHVEKIMSSTKLARKSDIYRFLNAFAEDGLITASGPTWKEHRKIIQPMISLKFVNNNVKIMDKHAKLLVKNMTKMLNVGYVDIHDVMHRCSFDIIGELIYGTKVDTQLGRNLEVIHNFESVFDNVFGRMMKPWLHPDALFNLSSYKTQRTKIIDVVEKFTYKAIDDSFQRVKAATDDDFQLAPIIDQLTAIMQTEFIMSHKSLKDHLTTLFSASEDTMTITTAMVCVCLGMYPEYQEIALNEIREVFGTTPREITHEDLSKLKYLEMCIKEVLRLAPIAPFILRDCREEFTVGSHTIPAGCDVMIPIFDIHRDTSQWENPMHFHPDHFLLEAVKARHPYAYMPFSMGPRVCIGKHLAMQSLKVMLVNVLQNYQFEAQGKFPDIQFRSDISVRPLKGYNVKISPRVWT